MRLEKPIIELWHFKGLGLIISHPTGVIYTNQAGGTSCQHPELEGAFIPLVNTPEEIDQLFGGPEWRGWCDDDGMSHEHADYIDSFLVSASLTRLLRVDRDKQAKSREAWIYVVFPPQTEYDGFNQFTLFPSGKGVLTWENSD